MSHPCLQTVPHGGQRVAAVAQRPDAAGCDLEIAFGAAAAFRGRIAEPGGDVAFFLQPIEGAVERAHRQGSAGAFFDFASNGHAVRVVTETQDCKQDDLLKLAQMLAAGHICSAW
jgi:hypothetical protein